MTWESALHDETTGEVVLTLVRLSHASWVDDIRLVGNTEDLEHLGETFEAAEISISLPDQADDRNPSMRWTYVDYDGAHTAQVRETNDEISVEISVVLASDPDTVNSGPFDGEIRSATLAPGMISGEITVYPVLEELANVKFRFNTIDYPGLT